MSEIKNIVHIVGAGPGDPELITVKGMNLLKEADIIVYAGSLVNIELLKFAKKDAEKINSASMHLEEIIGVMTNGIKSGKRVVRLQTGDPSLYGALNEQTLALKKEGISYEIIPGVSSAFAAIAALGMEFTLPEITQSVIFTRMEGKTPVPEKEQLREFAKHRATMCVFLSIGLIENVVKELLSGYAPDTAIAVVYKASWPDQKIVKGTLQNIAEKIKDEKITKTAMIIVGDVLDFEIREHANKSKLYDKEFEHEFRRDEANG
jgi:precorrin-4/cobalt-precorrin-4 C11-methyltransferase